MSVQMILLPVFVQVALTFALLFWMASVRTASITRGETKIRDIALGQPNWDTGTLQVGNCLANQFQFPMLFYVVVILALFTKTTDLVFVVLAWIFVVSRLVHAYVHTTSNHVPTRFKIFAVGIVAVMTGLNIVGSEAVAKVQTLIVYVVLGILSLFAVTSLANLDPDLLAPSGYPPFADIVSSVALTFFAFLGFGVVTFTAKDLANPRHQLPRAMYLALGLATAIYLGYRFLQLIDWVLHR